MGDTRTIRIATWNLERVSSRAWKRAPAQDRRMREVGADIWVLTETFTDRSPGDEFAGVCNPPHLDRRPDPDERLTAVWSRWPCEPIVDPPPHRRGSVATRIDTPIGPVVVYGSVIAWAHERRFEDGRPARLWEVHAAEIDRQAGEWRQLRETHRSEPFVVAGDLNQARDGRPRGYGTHAVRAQLTEGLDAAGLRSLTDVDLVEDGPLVRSHVEHICASAELDQVGPVSAWPRIDDDGVRLSDHPTLAVDVRRRASSDGR